MSNIVEESSHGGRDMVNIAEIEKVFNETFVPASDHDFLPITSHDESYQNEFQHNGKDLETIDENNTNCRGTFFAHRQTVPDPEEVID